MRKPPFKEGLRPHDPGDRLSPLGQNGVGKTALAKLLCRLNDPQAGAIEVDGATLSSQPAEVAQ